MELHNKISTLIYLQLIYCIVSLGLPFCICINNYESNKTIFFNYRRVAALEQKQHRPGKPGPSHHGRDTSSAVNTNKYKGLSKEDIAIAERLQKLKDERKKGCVHILYSFFDSTIDLERLLLSLSNIISISNIFSIMICQIQL